MFRRRFPRLIWRGDFLKDKELTRKPRGHESGEFVNRVVGKTKAARTAVPGAEWQKAQADLTSKCRLGGARDENRRPFTVQPGRHPALLEILGSKPLLLLCWGNQSSARRFSLPELSDAQFAKNPERPWTQDL